MSQHHAAPKGGHYLTVPEIAARCGLTYVQALRTLERGFYPQAVRIGRQRGIPVEDVEGFQVLCAK